MKKIASPIILTALITGLSGCATPPEPLPVTPVSFFEKLQNTAAEFIDSGGIAVVGIGESKSLELALNKAKIDGRIKLADRLEIRMDGLPENLADQIQRLAPKELKHETTNGVITAYALMELGPQILKAD